MSLFDEKDKLLEELKKRPDLLGLQYMLEQLEKFVKFTNDKNYPPTSIEKKNDNSIVIYIALAGFKKSQLTINLVGCELIVTGKKDDNDQNKTYVQKGIAFRSFEKKFLVGNETKIIKACYINGLLQIYLHIPTPVITDQIQAISIEDSE